MAPSSFSGFSSRGRGIIGAGKVLTREKRETRERNRQRRRTGTGRGYWGYLQLVFFTPRKRKAILNDSDPNRINSAVMKSQ